MELLRKWSRRRIYILLVIILVLTAIAYLYHIQTLIETRYQAQESVIMYDRTNIAISVGENSKGHYTLPVSELPNTFTQRLLTKEDRYFYYHPGINPISIGRALFMRIAYGHMQGGSTITQQLAKNILGTESKRTVKNKIHELIYTIALECFYSKNEIITMYANSVYMGNQLQGFEAASLAYFNKSLIETSYSEQVSLLATLAYPSSRNPWKEENEIYALTIHKMLAETEIFTKPQATETYSFQDPAFFEIQTSGVSCEKTCHMTIDTRLTASIRKILDRRIIDTWKRGGRNGAIVVLDPKKSEIVALVGTKNPLSTASGDQINMTLEPRPIGSTVKPFIYLKGFMSGLRPYSLVDDREYKYPIATGFPLYPKNYDGKYHGVITLHEALSNSLNVPSVKVLEFIGLNQFYQFLSHDLSFLPIRELSSYEYGIALGGLEMDLLTLTHYFSLFPRGGTLEPLTLSQDSNATKLIPPQSHISAMRKITDESYTQLLNTILSDRLTGVNQFGLESNLNIENLTYAVKTGTSRDFHDSWVIGYTPDFVVGVWLGNVENEPLESLSGQTGAGAIWQDVMNLLANTSYNKKSPFLQNHITQIPIENSVEWGPRNDTSLNMRTTLIDETLITSPHQGDTYEFFDTLSIPLSAQNEVLWFVNEESFKRGSSLRFKPQTPGTYTIRAHDEKSKQQETVTISVTLPQ